MLYWHSDGEQIREVLALVLRVPLLNIKQIQIAKVLRRNPFWPDGSGRISKVSAAQRTLSHGLTLLPSFRAICLMGRRKTGICSDLQGCHLDPFLEHFQVEGCAVFGPTKSLKYWIFSEEL